MPSNVQLDACGRRRSPATLSSFHQGRRDSLPTRDVLVAGALAACASAPRRMRLFEVRPYRRPDEGELSAGVVV
jgi:hypothetical protein